MSVERSELNVERSAPRAVFLSYASEDAEAAKRIADALRAFGVEVWFDQNELRGGDSWDANIRKQIKECTLFLPVISVRTEDRHEGYFRREWNLAVERMHDMAKGVSFLLPVVIDDTKETESLVPDEFRTVQWTRLPHGLPGTEFVEHVRGLLEGKRMPRRQTRADGWSPISPLREGFGGHAERAENRTSPENPLAVSTGSRPRAGRGGDRVPPRTRKGIPIWAWAAVAIVVATGLAVAFLGRSSRIANPVSRIAPSAPDKSIAVLPFNNRSKLEDDQYFTDGIHDDLLTQISRIRDIKTISRTSVMTYKGTTKNMRTIGEELGVATLLEGGVQRAGNQVRINVQLIDAATDVHLWAETYTREMTAENIFAIQSEIAAAITNALKAVLTPEEKQQLEKLPTQNLAALEALFQATAAPSDSAGNRKAIEHLQRAIELDPGFADAHALLGQKYLLQTYTEGLPLQAQVERAEPFIRRALELDDSSSRAHAALGQLNRGKGELADSATAYQRAIELNPNDVEIRSNYGLLQLWGLRDVEAAVASFRKAFELDPLNVETLQQLADALLGSGRIEESEVLLERLFESDPENVEGVRTYGDLQESGYNRYDKAIQAHRHVVALDSRNPNFAAKLARCYLRIGDNKGAEFWFERALALAPQSQEAAYLSGMRHMVRSEKEEALSALRAVPANSDSMGFAFYFLSEADLEEGRPERALEREVARGIDDTVIRQANVRRACSRAYLLAAAGKREQADDLIDRILAKLPSLARMGTWGYGDGDVIVCLAQGDNERAIDALREFSNAGGCDATLGTGPSYDVLRDEPEFQELMAINQSRLAEQRANLARMEANGELADIPPPPEKQTN